MTGLITLREPVVTIPDPEPREIATTIDPLPLVDDAGQPADWSYRQANGLRFERWRAARGDFDGDRFALAPEPLPAIDPADNGRTDR